MKKSLNKKYLVIIAIVAIVLIWVSIPPFLVSEAEKQKVIELCIKKCKNLPAGSSPEIYYIDGPCLLNPVQEYQNWVCDVAHSPREAIDNKPENQCSAYREGKAKHFVEVDLNCNLIRAV